MAISFIVPSLSFEWPSGEIGEEVAPRDVIDAFGPMRCFWGSDFSRLIGSYSRALNSLNAKAMLDANVTPGSVICMPPAGSIDALLIARMVQGLGYIALTVAGATFVLRITSGDHRRKAMALWAAHTPAGFAGAVLLVTQLAASDASWRWAFSGHAILTAAFGVIAWLVVRGMQGWGV